MRSVFLVTLSVLFAVSLATPLSLYVVPKISEEEATKLASIFDVRGHYENFALVALAPNDTPGLLRRFPAAWNLAKLQTDRTIFILEKVNLQGDEDASLLRWRSAIEKLAIEHHFQILFSVPRRVVISAAGDVSALRQVELPGDTEILPLLNRPMIAVRNERINSIRKKFAQRADYEALLAQVNQTTLKDFIEYLSGEAAGSPLYTRNAYSINQANGVETAAEYLVEQYTRFGFTTELQTFRNDMGPNVIAVRRGSLEPDTYVVLGAHYDSRASSSSSTTQQAPGANDDGSGTGALLQIAKIINDNNLNFRYSIVLGSWCGEEQGLIGSRAYAQRERIAGTDILAMFQADMIAYRATGEAFQTAYPTRYDDPELTSLSIEIVNTYIPSVETCYTSACCSDHQSFTEQGYSATQLFERCGPIADNRYHNSGDLLNRPNYDLQQLAYNTQAQLANLLVLAEAY